MSGALAADSAETSDLGDGDSVLFARRGCAFSGEAFELACNDDIDVEGGNYASAIVFEATAGQTVALFVNGYNGQSAGPFTLTVRQL